MGFPQAPEHRMVVGDGKVRGYSMGEAHGVLWLQFQGVLQLRESYSLARRSTGACWASNPGRGAWIGRFEAFAVRWYCSQRLLSVGHHSPQTSLDAFSKWHIKHNSRNCCVGGVSKVAVSAVFFWAPSLSHKEAAHLGDHPMMSRFEATLWWTHPSLCPEVSGRTSHQPGLFYQYLGMMWGHFCWWFLTQDCLSDGISFGNNKKIVPECSRC